MKKINKYKIIAEIVKELSFKTDRAVLGEVGGITGKFTFKDEAKPVTLSEILYICELAFMEDMFENDYVNISFHELGMIASNIEIKNVMD